MCVSLFLREISIAYLDVYFFPLVEMFKKCLLGKCSFLKKYLSLQNSELHEGGDLCLVCLTCGRCSMIICGIGEEFSSLPVKPAAVGVGTEWLNGSLRCF